MATGYDLFKLSSYYNIPTSELLSLNENILEQLKSKVDGDKIVLRHDENADNDSTDLQTLHEQLNNITLKYNRVTNEKTQLADKISELEVKLEQEKCNNLHTKLELEKMSITYNSLESKNRELESDLSAMNDNENTLHDEEQYKNQCLNREVINLKNDILILETKYDKLLKGYNDTKDNLKEKISELLALDTSFKSETKLKDEIIEEKDYLIANLTNEIESLKNREINEHSSDINIEYGKNSSIIVDKQEYQRLLNEALINNEKIDEYDLKVARLTATVNEFQSKTGINFVSTDDFCDFIILKKEIQKLEGQRDLLQEKLEYLIHELENHAPELNNQYDKINELELLLSKEKNTSEHFKTTIKEIENEKKNIISRLKLSDDKIETLREENNDLTNQIQFMLISNSIQNDKYGELTENEIKFIKALREKGTETSFNELYNSQDIISDRLIRFESVISLQQKNMELIKTLRLITKKLDNQEHELRAKWEAENDDVLNEAKEEILKVVSESDKLKEKISELQQQLNANRPVSHEKNGHESVLAENKLYTEGDRLILDELKNNIPEFTKQASNIISMNFDQLTSLYNKNLELTADRLKAYQSRDITQKKLDLLQDKYDYLSISNEKLKEHMEVIKDTIRRKDETLNSTIANHVDCKASLLSVTNDMNSLMTKYDELKYLKDQQSRITNELKMEREQLKMELLNIKTVQIQSDLESAEYKASVASKINDLEITNSNLSKDLRTKEQELQDFISTKNRELDWYQKKFDIFSTMLKRVAEGNDNNDDIPVKTENINSSDSFVLDNFSEQVEGDDTSSKERSPSCNNISVFRVKDPMKPLSNNNTDNVTSSNINFKTSSDLNNDFELLFNEYKVIEKELEKAKNEIMRTSGDAQELEKLSELLLSRDQEHSSLMKSNRQLQEKLNDSEKHIEQMDMEIKKLNDSILEYQKNTLNITSEITLLRNRCKELENKLKEASLQSDFKEKYEMKSKENDENIDRFNRLKKQANARLHSSKEEQNALNEQISSLKKDLAEVQSKLEVQSKTVQELETQIKSTEADSRSRSTSIPKSQNQSLDKQDTKLITDEDSNVIPQSTQEEDIKIKDVKTLDSEVSGSGVNLKNNAPEEKIIPVISNEHICTMESHTINNNPVKESVDMLSNEESPSKMESDTTTTKPSFLPNQNLTQPSVTSSFTFSPLAMENPFTSPNNAKTPTSSFGMKPAFSFGSNPFTSNTNSLGTKMSTPDSNSTGGLFSQKNDESKDTASQESSAIDTNAGKRNSESEDNSSETKKTKF
ncbi:hypothetical protein TPHA_0E00230 [Tetrapisispora phaffii CBS 4417]|uniref:NUA/TPR/MLP1-2-like domain-containing protein n=1 Tax=Tetrapisispora phaffii (strain ATCC 24235 / CBS 4417 / NBRC 1672 / NRRL Y-8282 / UCD 70-5) TaxID=1071381 RepID=G8BT91_TETPH|nr:hypothetical protein TPHA_0E00230 [Tetrapisispora phaffii CBS 4417]CCE63119.1 hypothetical protein TPHA_0E00230 [Tetrapisispora phaffii CBS 4417]